MGLFNFLIQVGSKDKAFQILVSSVINLCVVALPTLVSLTDENDILTDLHHRVHIMSVDNCSDVILMCDFKNQMVDKQRCLRIQT